MNLTFQGPCNERIPWHMLLSEDASGKWRFIGIPCWWWLASCVRDVTQQILGGGFKYFLIFTPSWGRFPVWLMFFRWVGSTTNQYLTLAFLPMIDSKGADWLNRDNCQFLSSGIFRWLFHPRYHMKKNRCQPTLQGSVGMSHDWKPNYITTRVDPWKWSQLVSISWFIA